VVHTQRVNPSFAELVMGTAVSIDIRDNVSLPQPLTDVVAWLHHVDDVFSPYKSESPISAIGRGDLPFYEATDEVRHVLRLCEQACIETNGAFNAFDLPAPNGTRFDPCGLVKGWSIELAADILEGHGCRHFCINAGGDIALRGRPTPDALWRVGVRHPELADALAFVIEAEGRLAIATSATYERGAHIVDPSTGLAVTDLASATVIGPDLTNADVYATAAFVMGLDALDWIETIDGYELYLITHDDTTLWSPGFSAYRASGMSS
jgi:FAD:protein FMN transferase